MLFKGKKEAKRLVMILKDYTPGGSHPLTKTVPLSMIKLP